MNSQSDWWSNIHKLFKQGWLKTMTLKRFHSTGVYFHPSALTFPWGPEPSCSSSSTGTYLNCWGDSITSSFLGAFPVLPCMTANSGQTSSPHPSVCCWKSSCEPAERDLSMSSSRCSLQNTLDTSLTSRSDWRQTAPPTHTHTHSFPQSHGLTGSTCTLMTVSRHTHTFHDRKTHPEAGGLRRVSNQSINSV